MSYGALTSFTVGLCDVYRYFADQALLMMSQTRSHTKHLLPTNTIENLYSTMQW